MTTLIIQHDDCLRHDTGPRHPEKPARLTAVLDALSGLANLDILPAPRADARQLDRVHPLPHRQALEAAIPAKGRASIEEDDNIISPGSMDAALRAAGSICFAIDEVLAGRADNAFCAVRPPGHHAEAARPMGYCLFNNVAIGARHAQAEHGLERIAIVDFDVHHGNGTQAIFERDPSVLFVSSHQLPLYPGTGSPEERGRGNILNLALEPGAGSEAFRAAWTDQGLPAVRAFEPDLLLVSAGFDAHRRDPLAQIQLCVEDYRWITGELTGLARQFCNGRLVSILEGGYDIEALAASARAHVEELAAAAPPPPDA